MKYIVDFTPTATQVDIDSYMQEHELSLVCHYDKLEKVYLVSGETLPPVTSKVEYVIENDTQPIQLLDVINLDLNTVREASFSTEDDKEWWKVASFDKVNYEAETQTFGIKGTKTVVYLVDSGVETSHPEFANSSIVNLFSLNDDFTDHRGHGTALASLIVGQTCGITGATLKSVKIFEQGVPTYLSDLLAAFNAIATDYLSNGQKPSVVNLSWSVSKNEYLENKINSLIDMGLIVVASAGNNSSPIMDVTPACMERVITVGAYNQMLTPCDFSNYTGTAPLSVTAGVVNYGELDGWAPGENIWVASLNGQYGFTAGTSLAAAITTAVMVYNLDIYINQLNEIRGLENHRMFSLPFTRINILTLRPPYEASKNLICTVKIDYYPTKIEKLIQDKEITAIAKYGVGTLSHLFNPYVYSTIEYDPTQIPAGLKIHNGILLGEAVRVSTESVVRTSTNLKLSGQGVEPMDLLLTITTYAEDQDLVDSGTSISALDPAMTVDLQGVVCTTYYTSCETTGCWSTCQESSYTGRCFGSGSKYGGCECYCY